jgi:mono/diheme cytochrome c family protein
VSRRTVVAAIGLVIALTGLVLGAVGAGRESEAAPAVLDGHALFVAKGCSSCHTGPDSTSAMNAGPPLVDAVGWAGSRRPGVDAATYLSESIREPAAFLSPARLGDTEMPALAVSSDEVDRLVDYLLER